MGCWPVNPGRFELEYRFTMDVQIKQETTLTAGYQAWSSLPVSGLGLSSPSSALSKPEIFNQGDT